MRTELNRKGPRQGLPDMGDVLGDVAKNTPPGYVTSRDFGGNNAMWGEDGSIFQVKLRFAN